MIRIIKGALVLPFLFLVFSASAIDQQIDKGRRLYLSNCISCHNKDPNLKGAVGPEIVETPLEVFTYKITTGKYPDKLPPKYIPKRKSVAMRSFPNLKNDAKYIWNYIQSQKKTK